MRPDSTAVVPSNSDSGATAVEYALMAGLIAAVIGGTVLALGQEVIGLLASVLPAF